MNSSFLEATNHPLCDLCPESPLEYYHVTRLTHILTHSEDGLYSSLPIDQDAYTHITNHVRDLIMATCMASHKAVMTESTETLKDICEGLRPNGSGGETSCAESVLDETQRRALLVIVIKCADLAGLVMDTPVADFWGKRMMEENLQQGMKEWNEGLTQTQTAVREIAEHGYFSHQATFLEHVVLPMYETCTLFTSPQFRKEIMEISETNLKTWRYQCSNKEREILAASITLKKMATFFFAGSVFMLIKVRGMYNAKVTVENVAMQSGLDEASSRFRMELFFYGVILGPLLAVGCVVGLKMLDRLKAIRWIHVFLRICYLVILFVRFRVTEIRVGLSAAYHDHGVDGKLVATPLTQNNMLRHFLSERERLRLCQNMNPNLYSLLFHFFVFDRDAYIGMIFHGLYLYHRSWSMQKNLAFLDLPFLDCTSCVGTFLLFPATMYFWDPDAFAMLRKRLFKDPLWWVQWRRRRRKGDETPEERRHLFKVD